jgi:hypothetical protein
VERGIKHDWVSNDYNHDRYSLRAIARYTSVFVNFLPPRCYTAYHNGRAVYGVNCLRLLERWDRGFESYSRHGCLYCVRLFSVVLCVGSGLATGSYRLYIGSRN